VGVALLAYQTPDGAVAEAVVVIDSEFSAMVVGRWAMASLAVPTGSSKQLLI
jgi:hypothetical protein